MQYPFGDYGFSVSVSVIGIMLAVAGLFLGLGYALNNRKFKEFGTEEIFQSIINGALVGGFLLLFSTNGVVNSTINSITMSNGIAMSCERFLSHNEALCLAYNYLSGSGYNFSGTYHASVLRQVTTMSLVLLSINTILGIIAALKIDLIIVSFSFAPLVAPILNQIQYVLKALTTIGIGAVVQSSIIIFIAISVLNIILPAGLVLRSFYPTRKLGGFLIALSIGLYVVLPLSYVLNASIADSFSKGVDQDAMHQVALDSSSLERNLSHLNNNVLQIASFTLINYFYNQFSNISDDFSYLTNQLINYIAYLIVYTFILPAFSLILTGISVRELSKLLGSEASFGIFDML